ncbi:hypothetical protein [uncultured Nostoc sp.]|uniref:hypothetical protein n=1 Tax=uncultured Nostoc sp. TaxID=340711 RepID=UPI0035C9EC49
MSFGAAPHYEQWFGLLSGGRSQNISISDKSNYFNMTLYTGVYLIIPITLRMYKLSNTREIPEYMNRFKSILLGGLLAAASIAALSQNANAAEFKSDRDHFNGNTVAFNNSKAEHERQVREQRARELRERQAREQRARELRERQAREQRARELRERQARLYH